MGRPSLGHRTLYALAEGLAAVVGGSTYLMAEDGQIVVEATNSRTNEVVLLNALGDYESFVRKVDDLDDEDKFFLTSSLALQRSKHIS